MIVGTERTRGLDLIGTGDMGIGNTTASSAIVAAITGCSVADVTGRGIHLINRMVGSVKARWRGSGAYRHATRQAFFSAGQGLRG